ncbi:hypothetical protein HDU67_004873 [Dinochytrium kinnereticum]|nr:hypothetical protein HDU67_004873 [Dinochytrium kinnereticum]
MARDLGVLQKESLQAKMDESRAMKEEARSLNHEIAFGEDANDEEKEVIGKRIELQQRQFMFASVLLYTSSRSCMIR